MKIIGITGGKGGTGKSTIATALSYGLAKNHKVLLVDADVDCPDDHLILNIRRQLLKKIYQRIPKWDFDKCIKCGLCGSACSSNAIVSIKGKKPIFTPSQCNGCGACLITCPVGAISWSQKIIGQIYTGKKGNIDFLAGELKINEPVSELVVKNINKIIDKVKFKYDYIIIDTAAGLHCNVITALENCHLALAVTEPTPLGEHDLNLILNLLKQIKIKTHIILNRANIGEAATIEKLIKKSGKKIIAKIPYSSDIITQYAQGEPIWDNNINKLIKWTQTKTKF